ncbi:MAG: FtsX-like permease family protein [Planctomycetes bacterium]|nr:FtsX-like permease family protein [Planctomycetota bacterium]
MRINLAWRNLAHETARTAVAAAGVAFAVVLIFMQLGFFRSLERSATLLYDALDFDICIRSRDYLRVAEARQFPRARLYQALSHRAIAEANPLHVGICMWRNDRTGEKNGILMLGVPPGAGVFRQGALRGLAAGQLTSPERILVDRLTRPEYGPVDGVMFGDADVRAGAKATIAGHDVRIVGHYAMGAGFAANGSVMVSEDGFQEIYPGRTVDDVTLGLLMLDPAARASPESTAGELRRSLPTDVEVLSRDEILSQERDQWVTKTSYGLIFQIGIAVALLVGTAIVYQVLSSDVANLLPEYATLKAMGYGNAFLVRVVVQQALTLALLGFVPGYVCSHVLYVITAANTRMPIHMTWFDGSLVFALAVVMCGLSGIGAVSRLFRTDPAALF